MSNFGHSRVVILLLLAVAGVRAGDDSPRVSGPKLVCDEPQYSFGQVENTKHVEHEFVIRNEGDQTLEILRVHPGCGCTLVRLADKKIRPGKQTTLRARLTLKGRSGKQRIRITIHSNDPSQPRYTLFLVGEAIPTLIVRPERLFWGNIREDEAPEKTVELAFQPGDPVRILNIDIPSPAFVAETNVISAGKSYKVRIRAVPPLPRGKFEFSVTIRTDHPRIKDITIPMRGRVVGDLYTVPEELVLQLDTTNPVSRFLIVRSSRKEPFRVLHVEAPGSNIQVKIRTTGSSRSLINLKNMIAYPELDGRSVRIITDCDTMKEIFVPIRIRSPESGSAEENSRNTDPEPGARRPAQGGTP